MLRGGRPLLILLVLSSVFKWVAQTGFNLPRFVGCLVAGIVVGNLMPGQVMRRHGEETERSRGIAQAYSLASDICLGIFLTMALMGLQLWELRSAWLFLTTVFALQVAAVVVFTLYVVYPWMGRDYEASVVGAGFAGIGLGSTATAIMNMTAVTQLYGAAHQAFIVVPLVCGFFIDLVNALVIGLIVNF
ncbi:MAG: sodium/glutamate symporter [Burkholderiaceae bacterium]